MRLWNNVSTIRASDHFQCHGHIHHQSSPLMRAPSSIRAPTTHPAQSQSGKNSSRAGWGRGTAPSAGRPARRRHSNCRCHCLPAESQRPARTRIWKLLNEVMCECMCIRVHSSHVCAPALSHPAILPHAFSHTSHMRSLPPFPHTPHRVKLRLGAEHVAEALRQSSHPDPLNDLREGLLHERPPEGKKERRKEWWKELGI
jgi:hypothetical protein